MNHKVDKGGIYACVPKQAVQHYESGLFSYAKGEHFEDKCIVCQHKLDLSNYAPVLSKFDLLKQTETTP